MQINGMKIMGYKDIGQNSTVTIENKLHYDNFDKETKKDMFRSLQENTFKDSNYDDLTWKMYDEFGFYNTFNFSEISKLFIDKVKLFLLTSLFYKQANHTAYKKYRAVHQFLSVSNNLDINGLENLYEKSETWNYTILVEIPMVKQFLQFIWKDEYKPFFELLCSLKIPSTSMRKIPGFKNIVLFDEIVNDVIRQSSKEIKAKYFPVLLWWEITKIIPMRPTEFPLLKSNSLIEKKGKYYLKIKRRKNNNYIKTHRGIKPLLEQPISNKLHQIILEYQSYIEPSMESEYFLNYHLHNAFFNQVDGYHAKRSGDYFSEKILTAVLDDFTDNFIPQYYGHLCQGIKLSFNLGDTRHIAISNLILQGINPLTVASIAGQTSVQEQISYYGHIESYIESYTYLISKQFKNEYLTLHELKNMNTNYLRKSVINRTAMINGSIPYREIPHGYCISQNYPYECFDSTYDDICICNHFVPSETIEQELILSKIKKEEEYLKEKLHFIKSIIEKEVRLRDIHIAVKENMISIKYATKRIAKLKSYEEEFMHEENI